MLDLHPDKETVVYRRHIPDNQSVFSFIVLIFLLSHSVIPEVGGVRNCRGLYLVLESR